MKSTTCAIPGDQNPSQTRNKTNGCVLSASVLSDCPTKCYPLGMASPCSHHRHSNTGHRKATFIPETHSLYFGVLAANLNTQRDGGKIFACGAPGRGGGGGVVQHRELGTGLV